MVLLTENHKELLLDALASLKTMFKIKLVTDVFKISRLQSIRVLHSVTEYYRVLQSITEYYRVLQSITSITKTNLAHLLGPIFGLVCS